MLRLSNTLDYVTIRGKKNKLDAQAFKVNQTITTLIKEDTIYTTEKTDKDEQSTCCLHLRAPRHFFS